MQRRAEEALTEPPWTGKEEEAARRGDKAEDIFRLVDLEKIPLPEIPEAEPVGNQVFHIIDIIDSSQASVSNTLQMAVSDSPSPHYLQDPMFPA